MRWSQFPLVWLYCLFNIPALFHTLSSMIKKFQFFFLTSYFKTLPLLKNQTTTVIGSVQTRARVFMHKQWKENLAYYLPTVKKPERLQIFDIFFSVFLPDVKKHWQGPSILKRFNVADDVMLQERGGYENLNCICYAFQLLTFNLTK